MPREDTKYGDRIPDDAWKDSDDEDEDEEDAPPVAEVESHTVEILHRGESPDMRYRYVFRDGLAIGILTSHRLAESNQFDPAGTANPYEVPAVVRKQLADEFDTAHWADVVDIDAAEAFAEGPR